MRLHRQLRRNSLHTSEGGYVLLTLLLVIALMIIVAATVATSISFDIKRDREEEMIHRGVQYSRAIRAYYKKFGRYPTKLEDLENANNLRFLRKRYKDPITGQDFKLLHFGEVQLSFSGGMGGATIPGANPIGGNGGLNGGMNGGLSGGLNGPGSFAQNSAFGQNSSLGGSSNSFGQNPQGANAPQGDATQNGSTPPAAGTDPNSPTAGTGNGQGSGTLGSVSQDQLGGITLGGGPIVGVASSSKKDTIREFNHKKKYNEWQFIYDPATDRGGLLMTPNQPQLAGFGQPNKPLQPGMPGGAAQQPTGGYVDTGQPPPGMLNDPDLNRNPQPPTNPPPQ